jgi:hypothetical protein
MSVIVSYMRGGLGNQMFQYAMSRALALRNGADLKLDLSSFCQNIERDYGLDAYKIQASIASEIELTQWGLRETRWSRRIPDIVKAYWQKDISCYSEPHYQFDPKAMQLCAPIAVNGYWHSYKYFEDYSDIIRSEFMPNEYFSRKNDAIHDEILDTCSVSIHVRRGDYITDNNYKTIYAECNQEYYTNAIIYLTDRMEGIRIFIFSDDMNWAKNTFPASSSIRFVDNDNKCRPFYDMYLMSLCKHNIIANSSFSWWGAWLNPYCDKIVITPNNWYLSENLTTKDLIPSNWIRL